MATTKSAKNPTARNDTPDTPQVREGAIATMKVDELRRKLRGHGVKDTADLKKPELVKRLIKAEVADTRSGSKKSSAKKTSPAKSSSTKSSSAKATKNTTTKSAATKSANTKSATTKSKSSKNPTSRNDTPNTPGVSESAIATMKVDDLRRRLRSHGVKGTADLKKPELVKRLISVEVSAKKSTSKPAKSSAASAKKTVTSAASTRKSAPATSTKSTGKATSTKSTGKATSAKSTGKATTGKSTGKATSTKSAAKTATARTVTAKTTSAQAAGKTATAKVTKATKAGKASKAATGGKPGGVRTGKATSDSLKYSQEITSTADKAERAGRSLVTTDHEVIRQWAKARKAVPATVGGTEHGGHLGVLRFDFPGYSGDRLTPVEWDEWLATFDKRRLNFIYQQRQSNGKRSNFFRLENPDE